MHNSPTLQVNYAENIWFFGSYENATKLDPSGILTSRESRIPECQAFEDAGCGDTHDSPRHLVSPSTLDECSVKISKRTNIFFIPPETQEVRLFIPCFLCQPTKDISIKN